jgi:3-oxoacyl-[acyl-carrier protein] reductase
MTERPLLGALVTGASRGIGQAIAMRLAQDGYHIWVNFHNDERDARLVQEVIQSHGGSATLLPFDVSDPKAISAAIHSIGDEPRLRVLVLNAGIAQNGAVVFLDPDIVRRTIAVNLESFFYVTRSVLPRMVRARCGRIIAISSVAGLHGMPGQACYSATKAGVLAATYSLAAEVGRFGILVNAVVPGFIETAMTADIPSEKIPQIPLGRVGKAQEVAEVVSFLCSEGASYIHGAAIPVTGGLTK